MNSKVHTIIFDLDGTLSDSALLTIEAFKHISPDHGLPIPSIEAIRRATGHAVPEFYYILFPDRDPEIVVYVGLLVEQEELRLLPSLGNRLLFKGCQELLIRLKEYGIRLCIASTGAKDHVLSILDATGIKPFFETVFYGCPDKTEMLREIIGDSDKNGCVMVGDMKKDYDAARANGIVSVGACYGYCIKESSDFDSYVSNPLDLLEVLNISNKKPPLSDRFLN